MTVFEQGTNGPNVKSVIITVAFSIFLVCLAGWTAVRLSQQYYSIAPYHYYMLPTGNGRLHIQGELPDLSHKLRGQTICVKCNGVEQEIQLSFGEIDVIVPVPVFEDAAEITVHASRSIIPQEEGLGNDSRRLAFILRGMTWA